MSITSDHFLEIVPTFVEDGSNLCHVNGGHSWLLLEEGEYYNNIASQSMHMCHLKEDISIQEEHQMLLIPKSAIFSFPNIQPPRLVPASCAICLQTYTIGSKVVVYSSNPKCKHCFRNDYILRWLLTLSISLSFSISLSLSLLISL